MNDIKKKIEITCFAAFNLLFSFPGYSILGGMLIGSFIALYGFHEDAATGDSFGYTLIFSFIAYLFLSLIKLFSLIFFYLFRNFIPFVCEYLEKFEFDTKFRNKVLGASLLLDILVFLITFLTMFKSEFDFVVFSWLANCGGVLTSYLILLVFLKTKNFFRKKFTKSH